MQAGSLTSDEISTYTSMVLVNGTELPVVSWGVDRELSGDLPSQVVAVSGITQATGTIVWATKSDISEGGRNPWNRASGWIPSRGDRVEIFVSDGTTEWKQFHGLIDKTTGGINEGFQSTIIDDYDKLSAEVSHVPLVSIMPPEVPGGAEDWRRVGLHPLYFVDYALRRAGFFATPPREPNTNVYAPLQGSSWPNYGFLRVSPEHGFNTVTPWGLGRRDFTVEYRPSLTKTMSDRTQVTMLVAPDHIGAADFFVDYGSRAHHLRLAVNDSRVAIAFKNGVEVCRLPMGSGTVISMLSKNGQLSLRTDTGAEASGTFTASGSTMSAIVINASANASVAGLQVSHPETLAAEHMSTRWKASARFDCRSLRLAGIINASPTIEGRRAGDLVDEINHALLAGMWIDENGVMQWAQSDTLRMRAPSRTVTTMDDILSLDWEIGLLQSSSRVTVKGMQPSITRGRWRNTVLARGNAGSMKSGDTVEIFLEPETDTDWIMPSFNFIEIGGTVGIWGSYNQPQYSAVGMYFSADGGTTDSSGLTCKITTEQLGLQKVLVKYEAGQWPSDVEGVIATSPVNVNLWPKNRGNDLPRLMGMGKVQWFEDSLSVEGAGGPGPELVHDAGVWANRTVSDSTIRNLAEYLGSQTAVPQPVIQSLALVPDPRLQLGDVVTIDSPNLMGVSLTALIVGVSNSFGDRFEQSLSVRIISTATSYTTYAEYNEALGGNSMSYQQWQALGPVPQSYQEFNNS